MPRPPRVLQVRKRKWDSYRSGEELFGLPVTQYPELERTEEEITMLDKLYRWGDAERVFCFWQSSAGA